MHDQTETAQRKDWVLECERWAKPSYWIASDGERRPADYPPPREDWDGGTFTYADDHEAFEGLTSDGQRMALDERLRSADLLRVPKQRA